MKNMSKATSVFMATVIVVSMLSGCGAPKEPATSKTPVTSSSETSTSSKTTSSSESTVASSTATPVAGDIVYDQVQEYSFCSNSAVMGLNALLNSTTPDNVAANLFLESLVVDVADENNASVIKPGMAESWTVSDDGTVYTFKIRDNANWADGVPVTAKDFVFTYQTMATPVVASTNAWLFDGVILNFGKALFEKDGKKPTDIGAKAIDDKTLEITLEKACPYFLELLTGAKPVREDKWKEYGNKYGSSPETTIMNGQYVIQSWDPGVQMTLVKNEKYWDAENVRITKLNRKVLQEPATRAQALLSGDIDILSVNEPEWKKMIEDDGRFEKITGVSNSPEFLTFNANNKYFKNPKIRLAFSLALDREKYIKDLLNDQGEPLYSMMPSVTGIGGQYWKEAVNGKNEILKELIAKHPDPKALLIEGLKEEGLDPDPAKMDVSYISRGTTEFSKKSSEWYLQEFRERLGVEIKIDMVEWNIMWDRVDAGEYDIATGGWGPDYNDPYGLLVIYDPVDGYFNSTKTGWTGPDADKFHELLVKSSTIKDTNERAQVLVEAERILVGTALIIPTYAGEYTTYISKYVKGYHENPHSAVDYKLMGISGR